MTEYSVLWHPDASKNTLWIQWPGSGEILAAIASKGLLKRAPEKNVTRVQLIDLYHFSTFWVRSGAHMGLLPVTTDGCGVPGGKYLTQGGWEGYMQLPIWSSGETLTKGLFIRDATLWSHHHRCRSQKVLSRTVGYIYPVYFHVGYNCRGVSWEL